MALELEPNALDPTTLVTFLFRVPPEVRTVELLGSWDNFNVPYCMHHDRRRGNGFWSGCFKFENIIYDGDNLKWSKPRNGGLRQGGTYWYYYRLNYDIDSFDERQPMSTNCPLLPGQKVNILDVPIEMVEPPERCRSAHADIVGTLADSGDQQTMEPGDKFASVEAPPISKIHARCLSDEALDGRLQKDCAPLIVVEDTISPVQSAHSAKQDKENVPPTGRQERAESRASSVYSQEGGGSAPVSPRTVSKRREQLEDDDQMPDFPYPDSLGPSFLGFGATLFGPPGPADVVADRDDSNTLPAHLQMKSSELGMSPQSVQNVQFYGSRPGTNLTDDSDQHRPRMYSLPNLEIGEYVTDSQLGSPASPSSRAGYEHDEYSANDDDAEAYDLTSPTFSADTISTAGQNTPWRLSAQNSLRESTRHDSTQFEDENLVDIADRLKALDANEQPNLNHRRSVISNSGRNSYELKRRLNPRSFVNYSLPTIASESNQSLVKTTSNPSAPPRSAKNDHEAFNVPAMSATIFPGTDGNGQGSSAMDDIFSELGFLGSSIA